MLYIFEVHEVSDTTSHNDTCTCQPLKNNQSTVSTVGS